MDRTISATVEASPTATLAALSDLGTYPQWLALVASADRAEDTNAEPPVWNVTLRARLGRLARSKRLRMRRTEVTDGQVRFEREEIDGRTHANWILQASVEPLSADRCHARVHLHYSGALWSAPLEIVLSSFEGTAADRLSAYLADG